MYPRELPDYRQRCQVTLAMTEGAWQNFFIQFLAGKRNLSPKLQLLSFLSLRKKLSLMGVGLDTFCGGAKSFKVILEMLTVHHLFYVWYLEHTALEAVCRQNA